MILFDDLQISAKVVQKVRRDAKFLGDQTELLGFVPTFPTVFDVVGEWQY